MDSASIQVAKGYDESYRAANYFHYRRWLFRPFINALLRRSGVPRGATILDVGCGQGFFSALFAEFELISTGIDISHVAVDYAKRTYGHTGARFIQGDIMSARLDATFDCVFVRGCSAYNRPSFANDRSDTDALLRFVKPGGALLFCYATKLNAKCKSTSWRYHTIAEAQSHFSAYPNAQVLFSLRMEAMVLRELALTPRASAIAQFVSRTTRSGGELIAIIPKVQHT